MLKRLLMICAVGLFAVACSDDTSEQENVRQHTGADADNYVQNQDTGPGSGGGTDVIDDVGECTPGESIECADDSTVVICNDDGDGVVTESCPGSDPHCFQGTCGDQICDPGAPSCLDAETSQVCNDEGTGYGEPMPCGEGQLCEDGICDTICEFGPKQRSSHFGCEYWTIYLDQYHEPDTLSIGPSEPVTDVPHSIVISNPNEDDAVIHFETFIAETVDVQDPVVPAGESRSFTMPRLEMNAAGIFRKAIFVRSSVPVTAHQFNPPNNDDVYSNDASLLLPISSLGVEYYVMNWPTQVLMDSPMMDLEDQKSYVTVIASEPGVTNVVVNTTADIIDGEDFSGFPAGTSRNFELSYGDVLNLQASTESIEFGEDQLSDNDLTGTRIGADQPVAVFAGHEQAVIGYDNERDSCCADHIEQQLFPVADWGERYIAPFSPGRTETKDQWVIVAGEDGTTVETDPPQAEADGITLDAGDYVKFFTADNFEVQADGKISVGQFLTSQQQTAEVIGDPAFVLAVPIERFRDDYHLLVPEDYERDFITMIRPAGVEITLDGNPVDDGEFEPVGSGEFETGYVEVEAGVYVLESDEPFGAVVHGLDNAVSYGYPGGLNMVGAEEGADATEE